MHVHSRYVQMLQRTSLNVNFADADGLKNSSEGWNRLAASFQAEIDQQPALLVGGELREYQMQVNHL